MAHPNPADRRSFPRFQSKRLTVSLRPKGRLARLEGIAVDFNRFGLAVVLDQPMIKDKPVFLSLQCGTLVLDNLVGVVHNCISQDSGYRLGIQFRTSSQLQFDREDVERTLLAFEAKFAEADAVAILPDQDE